ncbi:coiled-coil domain-containing protein 125 [Salarias fasciatus]|uniref:coiled-coil domain-containing protein 125 n=1 Tax=Salarias fasciatus TaxID=181472 RepID=UPI00117671EB|nr:coiled-coil domain-containing protein 125 [Salarias fasciatus]
MQDVGEPRRPEDDMADGDLGDGTRSPSRRTLGPAAAPERPELRLGGRRGEAQHAARWNISRLGSLADWSKDKLKDKLQEAAEVIDALSCELEVTHRYLEGKYEALRILQGKAILDRATSHTQSLQQKSEEKAKALEKEVNSLQWELSFLQLHAQRLEQSWEHRYSRSASVSAHSDS